MFPFTANTPVTKNMVNKRERLAMMKPTAFLIITARGGCVDEDAPSMRHARMAWIAGAGLDAIKKEPVDPAQPRFLTLDNVITIRISAATHLRLPTALPTSQLWVVQEVYEGKKPTWPINDVDYKTAKTYTDTKKPDTKTGWNV